MESEKYILDTHVLIWMCFESSLLSKKVNSIIQSATEKSLVILSVSFWEIGVKQKKQAINLPVPLREYLSMLEQISTITFYDPTAIDWVRASELDWQHKDPIDRLLVSIAQEKKYKVITKDSLIREFTKLAVW